MEAPTYPNTPSTLEEKYNATIANTIIINSENSRPLRIIVLQSKVCNKVALYINNAPVEFRLTSGETTIWVGEWGILKDMNLLLVGDGISRGLGIYRLDGSSVILESLSSFGTSEKITGILKESTQQVGDYPFLLTLQTTSLSNIPAFGPM